jgi:NADP-dependent 3-hydroxy acid dehydrogenase YdfG
VSDIAGHQHAIVTGAGSGIGRAIALALAQEGTHVRLVGRDAAKLARVATSAPGLMSVLAADLASAEGIARVVDGLGPELHVLVHSAGGYARGPIETMDAKQWAALDRVNVHVPILLTAACLPQLRAASGQVVFVNSSAGLRASPGIAAYAAGKHALKAAVDTLRQEVNADGIRVLSIFPGRTDTPMQRDVLASEQRTAKPGTLMRAEDVASMVLAALKLPASAEVTDIAMRPLRPL